MEEQKNKTVEMNPNKKDNIKKEQRYSYEELNNICIQLQQQNQKLMAELQKMDISNVVARLNYLFRVVECASSQNTTFHFDSEFVQECITEIENSIRIPKEDTEETKEN